MLELTMCIADHLAVQIVDQTVLSSCAGLSRMHTTLHWLRHSASTPYASLLLDLIQLVDSKAELVLLQGHLRISIWNNQLSRVKRMDWAME